MRILKTFFKKEIYWVTPSFNASAKAALIDAFVSTIFFGLYLNKIILSP